MSIIYEVNLNIEPEIKPKFLSWLDKHIKEMLQVEGFNHAHVFTDLENADVVVQYHVTDKQSLENYFTNFADKMRAQGLEKFGNHFQATRRVMSIHSKY